MDDTTIPTANGRTKRRERRSVGLTAEGWALLKEVAAVEQNANGEALWGAGRVVERLVRAEARSVLSPQVFARITRGVEA